VIRLLILHPLIDRSSGILKGTLVNEWLWYIDYNSRTSTSQKRWVRGTRIALEGDTRRCNDFERMCESTCTSSCHFTSPDLRDHKLTFTSMVHDLLYLRRWSLRLRSERCIFWRKLTARSYFRGCKPISYPVETRK